VLAVFLKDLRIILRDRWAVAFSLLVPILVISIIATALFSSDGGSKLLVPVVDDDQGPVAGTFLKLLGEHADVQPMGRAEAEHLVRDQNKAPAAIVFPEGLSKRYLQGKTTELELLTDPAQAVDLNQVKVLLLLMDKDAAALADPLDEERISLRESNLTGNRKEVTNFEQNVPGFSIMFMLLAVVFGTSMSLHDEREWGTLPHLLVAPSSFTWILVGKLAARWSSRPILVVVATICGLTLVALSVTPNAITTGAVLFVFGAAYGSWDVAMNIQGSYVDRQAGRDYMPRYHASWSVGAAAGAGFGALMAAAGLGLTAHFAIVAAVACIGSIAIVLRLFVDDREPRSAAAVTEDAAGETVEQPHGRLLDRRLILIGLITLCACLLEGAAADWIALYLTDERQATEALAALGYGIWATAMALSRFSGTTLIGRLGRARAVRLAGAVVLAGVVATLAAPGVYGSLVGVLLWGAGVALVFPASMSAGGETPGRAADGIAAVSTIGYGGFLVGPPLIGLVANQVGLGTALWVLPVLALGIVLLAPVVSPPKTPTS